MSMSYEKVMAILEDERQRELAKQRAYEEQLHNELDPLGRLQTEEAINFHLQRYLGITLAINRIRREGP